MQRENLTEQYCGEIIQEWFNVSTDGDNQRIELDWNWVVPRLEKLMKQLKECNIDLFIGEYEYIYQEIEDAVFTNSLIKILRAMHDLIEDILKGEY